MSRIWDTPEFWARQEADEMLRDYPDASPAELAVSLKKSMESYDGGIELGEIIVSEMRRRSKAGVRFWPGPTALSAGEAAGAGPVQYGLLGNDEIPW